MKHLTLMSMLIGAVLIFFGCQQDSPVATELNQSDLEITSLAKLKTGFTGTCNFVSPGNPGTTTVLPNGNTMIKGQTVVWYDEADDSRVTGISNWTANWLITGVNTAKLWGKCEILVGTDPNDPGILPSGKWEISWHGYQTPTPNGFKVVCDAVGTGKEGVVKGLVAKWVYTMDTDVGFVYLTEGEIFEK